MSRHQLIQYSNMKVVKDTIISQCLALANTALESSWTLHKSTEALFWFRTILKIDPLNATARLGSARVYQYIASQPWWHNNISLAKSSAFNALAMLEEPIRANNLVDTREKALLCGQIYSAIGQSNVAERCFNDGLNIDPVSPTGHYFLHFNDLFIDPKGDRSLAGLNKAVGLAEAEGSQRQLAVALYFRGFANTLFSHYYEAITDLKRSMTINPGYGSPNLALIAAMALTRHRDTYKALRYFRGRYPNFCMSILDYMWVDRSSCAEYHRLVRPVVEIVKIKLGTKSERAETGLS
jgi:tetratricopeptide (TPR) repeat protein